MKITLTAKEKKLPAWRRRDILERKQRIANRVKATGEIELLQYKFIEQGFYEVMATTWSDKISFEGNMCGGLLKRFIKEVLAGGGKVERVTYSVVDKEAKEDLRHARVELKELYNRVKRARKILDY
jgi:hypothetical protein